MTTNQEGRQAAIRASTGTTGQAVEDWHALFDDAGIAAGSFNERMLAWINAELGTSYTNLNGAMWAYADNAGYDRWNAMATLVLAVAGAEELAGDEANALALDFTDDYYQSSTGFYGSAYILDAATPANDTNTSPVTAASSLLTYTSPSPKLTLGPDGTYRYQAHNLYLNSASPANQSITVVSGASYAVTITGSVSVTASGAATGTWTAGTNTFTAATTTLTLGSTSGSGTVHVRRTPSDSTYLATAGAIRYDLPYEWNTSGVLQGIRVEPAATNLIVGSRNLYDAATTWVANNATTSTLTGTGIDGVTNTAGYYVGNTTNGPHGIYYSGALTTSNTTNYTISVYVSKTYTNGRYISISLNWITQTTDWGGAVFDISDGTVSSENSGAWGDYTVISGSAKVVDYGNFWRLSVGVNVTTGRATNYVLIGTADSDGQSGASRGWGASTTTICTNTFDQVQIETGSVATSPILTYGATATRLADEASRAVTGYPHSATANSGLVQFVPLNTATATAIIQLDDGTSNEVVSIGYDASANIGLTVTDGGAAQTAPLADGTVTANATETIGFSWKANDFLLSDNGATAVADTSGTLPTVTTLKIRASGGPILLRKLLLVPVEKAAAEVEAYGATS